MEEIGVGTQSKLENKILSWKGNVMIIQSYKSNMENENIRKTLDSKKNIRETKTKEIKIFK